MKRRMDYWSTWMLIVSILFHTILLTGGVELSFELSDNAKECFYQEIEKNVSSTLEFQVCVCPFPPPPLQLKLLPFIIFIRYVCLKLT